LDLTDMTVTDRVLRVICRLCALSRSTAHQQVPASVEVLCKECFRYCWSLTLVTFESNSKLREVALDCFEGSSRLHQIEYPPTLFEQSRTVGSQGAGAPSSSIPDKE
jgi:hypothetical protein